MSSLEEAGIWIAILGLAILIGTWVLGDALEPHPMMAVNASGGGMDVGIEATGASELFISLGILVCAVGIVIFLGAHYFGLEFSTKKMKLKIKTKKKGGR